MKASHRLVAVIGVCILVFLLVPSLLTVPMSFSGANHLEFPPRSLSLRWYRTFFTDSEWVDPTLFSVKVAVLTAVIATVAGTMATLALARGRIVGRNFLKMLILAPMIVPHIVIAIAIYPVFMKIRLAGGTLSFVIAHSILAIPYVVITVGAALHRFDPLLEKAALSLGATRTVIFFRIILPSILPGVVAGFIFALVTSFDEATISFFISGIDDKTLPRKLFENIDFDTSPIVAVAATVMTTVSIGLLGAMSLVSRARRHQPQTG